MHINVPGGEHAKDGRTLACLGFNNSTPRQNFKNPLHNFFGINMRDPYAKFQLSIFKTEEGRILRWHTDV